MVIVCVLYKRINRKKIEDTNNTSDDIKIIDFVPDLMSS